MNEKSRGLKSQINNFINKKLVSGMNKNLRLKRICVKWKLY